MKKFHILWISLVLLCSTVYAQEAVYDDGGKRDPFWPLVSASGAIISYDNDLQVSDMVLEGIISGGNNDYIAIVNGKIVEVGATLGRFKVQSIESNRVLLLKGQERFILNLKKGE